MSIISDTYQKAKGFALAGIGGLYPLVANYVGEAAHCPMAAKEFTCNYAGQFLTNHPVVTLVAVGAIATATTVVLATQPKVRERAYKALKGTFYDKPINLGTTVAAVAGGVLGWGLAKTAFMVNAVGQYYRSYGQIENPNMKEIAQLKRDLDAAQTGLEEARGDLAHFRESIYAPRNQEVRKIREELEASIILLAMQKARLNVIETGVGRTTVEQEEEITHLRKESRVSRVQIDLLVQTVKDLGGDIRIEEPRDRTPTERLRSSTRVSMPREAQGFDCRPPSARDINRVTVPRGAPRDADYTTVI